MSAVANESFLRAILEDPENDLPRLAYADWLDEQGDPRGELIRVQCELSPLTEEDERFHPLYKREQALLKLHKNEWLGPLADWVQNAQFSRGFVENITLGANQFLDRKQEIFSLTPIRGLKLTGMTTTHVTKFRTAPECSRLRELTLNIRKMTDLRWEKLITAPRLASLKKLQINWMGMDMHHLNALTELSARGLQEFDFAFRERCWPWTFWDWGVLFRSSVLSNLRSIAIHVNDLEHDFIQGVLSSTRFPYLQSLTVDHPYFGYGYETRRKRKVFQWLGDHPRFRELPSLNLSLRGLTSSRSIVSLLFPQPDAMQTERLQLAVAPINADDANRIAQMSRLTTLRLEHGGLGNEGVSILANSECLQNLRVLSLANNELTDKSAQTILESPYWNDLVILDLSRNALSKETKKALRKRFGTGVCKFGRS